MGVPINSVYANGGAVLSGDELNTFVQGGMLVADMRLFPGVGNMTIATIGTATADDGGGGMFYWSSSSTATDDGVNVVRPYGYTVGAWLRISQTFLGGSLSLAGSLTVGTTITATGNISTSGNLTVSGQINGSLAGGTSLPISGLSGLGTGVATALAANTTGTGGLVRATGGTLTVAAATAATNPAQWQQTLGGNGQTYHSFTTSSTPPRNYSTTYTNSNPNPMLWAVNAGGAYNLSPTISGTTYPSAFYISFTLVVPPGATYSCTASGGSLGLWLEVY